MKEIKIEKWTRAEDILGWAYGSTEDIVIIITQNSSFELLAEGIFIAALHSLKNRPGALSARLKFDTTALLKSPSTENWPEFLSSLAGVALVQCAQQIIDANDTNVTNKLIDALWEDYVLPNAGVIGYGKKQSIVCRFPGTPIPKCLRQRSPNNTPSRLQFTQLLRKLGKDIGSGTRHYLASTTEGELTSFLFEAFRNVLEHNTTTTPGIWGIVVEKVLLANSDEIDSRKQIPKLLQNHLQRAAKKLGADRNTLVLSVTVADYGPGIQHTLPRISETESSWDCLMRAFERGISRKPKSGSPEWGQGLPNILNTISHLKAVLFLRTAEIAAIADGTTGTPSWERVTEKKFCSNEIAGTSLTVTWVLGRENPDQGTFDFG